MSTVGSVGGTGAGAGGQYGQVPSRVTKARLRFSGKRGGAGGAGWAEVEVTGWDGGLGEEEGMEFDRIFGELGTGASACCVSWRWDAWGLMWLVLGLLSFRGTYGIIRVLCWDSSRRGMRFTGEE